MKHKSIAKHWIRFAMCAAILPTLTGCFTYGLWTPACQSRAAHPAIAGLVRNYPAKGDQAIIVTYRALGDWHDVNLVVPIDRAGHSLQPFAPVGKTYVVEYPNSENYEPVAGRLTLDQSTEILAQTRRIAADREALPIHFNAVDWHPVAKRNDAFNTFAPAHPGSICILAFKMDDAGQIVPISFDYFDGKPIHVPIGTHLLLVPTSVDRPSGDRLKNQVIAVALTPLSVAADSFVVVECVVIMAVVIPIAVPVFVIGEGIHPTNQPPAATMPATQPSLPVTVPVEIEPMQSTQPTR